MAEEKKKRCNLCSKFSCLVNQGMWWCIVGHAKLDAETCPDYDGAYDEPTYTSVSKIFEKTPPNITISVKNPMKQYKINRAKKKRKKERGVKHGRRK